MSSLSDTSKAPQAPSNIEPAALHISPSANNRRRLDGSRGSISITVPTQLDPTTTPVSHSDKTTPGMPATTTTTATADSATTAPASTVSAASPGAPLPRQNSSDDMDGYRSSCEGSVPEEGCHGSRENNSRSSSVNAAEVGSEGPLLSPQVLADLTKPGPLPERLTVSGAAYNGSGARSPALSHGSHGGAGEGVEHQPMPSPTANTATSSHSPPPSRQHPHAHQHRRQHYSRPRSAIGSAAREEERQRLIAMSSPEDRLNAASANSSSGTTSAAAAAPAATSSNTHHKAEAKSGRTTAAITPVSLAEASAADSDCSSTDAVCPGPKPVFASTNVKTAAAMMSVALGSESHEKAAAAASAASSSSLSGHPGRDGGGARRDTNSSFTSIAAGDGSAAGPTSGADAASGAALMRVFPPLFNSHDNSPATHALSSVEAAKSPLQATLSRLSRSSSNDSGAVEASMDGAEPPPPPQPTPPYRSTSLNPPTEEVNTASPSHSFDNVNGCLHPSVDAEVAAAVASAMPAPAASTPQHHGASLCTPVTALPPSGVETPMATSKASCPATAKSRRRSPLPEEGVAQADAMPVIAVTAEQPSAAVAAASSLPTSRGPASRRASHHTSPARAREAAVSPAAGHDVTHVADVASCVHTATNAVGASASQLLSTASNGASTAGHSTNNNINHNGNATPSSHLLTPTVDVSSSSSVGGHHLSVTEGNAFLKQSGSRREEAFYNMIQPYQEALVREAVRQAPHTVEHWRHQNASSLAAAAQASARRSGEECGGGKSSTNGDANLAPAAVAGGEGLAAPKEVTASSLTVSPAFTSSASNNTTAHAATPVASSSTITTTAPAAAGEKPSVIRHVHAGVNSVDSPNAAPTAAAVTTSHMDDVLTLCDARWEAYQQYEAEDMSSLDILASAPPPTAEEEEKQQQQQHRFTPLNRLRSNSVVANSPVIPNTDPEHHPTYATAGAAASTPTSPLHQVDKNLVELAARLWWTIRFRHFYRMASTAYEVQRQAAEAAGLSPLSPSAASLVAATAGSTAMGGVSRCSTPASQYRGPTSPSPGQHFKEETVTTPIQAQMPSPSSAAATAAAAAAAPPMIPLSGTATPNTMGSFAAPSSDGVASTLSQSERQYSAQKHRALQLLAAFVPRYHGTRRLFVRDVLRCERRGMAAAAAAAAAAASPTTSITQTPSSPGKEGQNPLTDSQREKTPPPKPFTATNTAVAKSAGQPTPAPAPKIVDADNDDDSEEDDSNDGPGGRKICRMIMLEYVCYKFRRPCVLDMKMGSRQYGLHPTAEKKRSKEQKAKLSTSGRYGIRLAGYRRWNPAESRYEFRSKLQCRPLTLTEVKNEVSAFMMHNRELERVFRRQLQRLRVAFSQQTVFRFYTSSLLFVYDAEDPLATARVTMVDFAYTYESKELLQGGDPDADFAYDVGYLKAIDTLLSLLA